MKMDAGKAPSFRGKKVYWSIVCMLLTITFTIIATFKLKQYDAVSIFRTQMTAYFSEGVVISYSSGYASSWDRSIHAVVAGKLAAKIDVKKSRKTPFAKGQSDIDPQLTDFQEEQGFLRSALEHFGNLSSQKLRATLNKLEQADSICAHQAEGNLREIVCISPTKDFIYLAQGTNHSL